MIKINDTLYETVKKYPNIKEHLILRGLKQVENEVLLKQIGSNLTFESICKSKGFNKEMFIKELNDIIEEDKEAVDQTLINEKEKNKNAKIKVVGVLPCPVKMPLLEMFETLPSDVYYDLKAASSGVDWLKDEIINEEYMNENFADIFISAGFDLFFDKRYIGKYRENKAFKNLIKWENYNEDFDNDYIDLKDPDDEYSIIGVVPAVFLINKKELGERKAPLTWEDLLKPEFENSVSLPVGDFDLFNAILLNINKKYGKEAILKLKKALKKSMHPSEMVKSDRGNDQVAITIMPYFFTKMIRNNPNMQAIWPKDGAIISPIFMLAKENKKEEAKEVIELISSEKVGEIISHNGRFPSTHPKVNNLIAKENKYMWLGWEYINNNDIGAIIEDCMDIFNMEV